MLGKCSINKMCSFKYERLDGIAKAGLFLKRTLLLTITVGAGVQNQVLCDPRPRGHLAGRDGAQQEHVEEASSWPYSGSVSP